MAFSSQRFRRSSISISSRFSKYFSKTFLLESVVKLSENDFKILRSSSNSGEFSTAIFLSEDFDEDDFDSFCLKILSDEHEREPFQCKQEILSWLKEKGLMNKKFPKILEEHLTIDKYGKISLQ